MIPYKGARARVKARGAENMCVRECLCVCVCVCVCVLYVSVCVCVCVSERDGGGVPEVRSVRLPPRRRGLRSRGRLRLQRRPHHAIPGCVCAGRLGPGCVCGWSSGSLVCVCVCWSGSWVGVCCWSSGSWVCVLLVVWVLGVCVQVVWFRGVCVWAVWVLGVW